MQLHSYLKQAGLSQGEFGQKLSPVASQGLVSQWIRGKTRITLDYALQIADATEGQVSPKDCAEMFSSPEGLAEQPEQVQP
ncbi:helix-turn-helix transcriptional regulator [Herbaspirillum huttiense]|uniref:helix-turn-helix transcriptional regulator n=1 Tax=Herbaspirillum huttiense TaxID=863372 RepID=UPI001AD1D426|nr:helix-turn-helix transcriptional regulator [Herbaspirillum huttiense]MBN9356203.1 helix-turn-helix transcriptional regulator [Herbaspirillum huttiense]